jgi:hypothetical protein
VEEREFYEQLVPLAKKELAGLSRAPEEELRRIEVESVETGDAGTDVCVVFRDPTRPGCRFGWRWAWVEGPRPEEVEFAAGVLASNFDEDLLSDRYGLPEECSPADSITWL